MLKAEPSIIAISFQFLLFESSFSLFDRSPICIIVREGVRVQSFPFFLRERQRRAMCLADLGLQVLCQRGCEGEEKEWKLTLSIIFYVLGLSHALSHVIRRKS